MENKSPEIEFMIEYDALCKKYGLAIEGHHECLKKLEKRDVLAFEIYNNGFGDEVEYCGIRGFEYPTGWSYIKDGKVITK